MTEPDPTRPRPTVRELIRTNPEARRRLGRAYAQLMGSVLAAVAAVGWLVLWLLARRSRRIRERLGPPRPVRWPDPLEPGDRHR